MSVQVATRPQKIYFEYLHLSPLKVSDSCSVVCVCVCVHVCVFVFCCCCCCCFGGSGGGDSEHYQISITVKTVNSKPLNSTKPVNSNTSFGTRIACPYDESL
jgi:hypothetical protein